MKFCFPGRIRSEVQLYILHACLDAITNPQVVAREMLKDVDHPSGISLRITDTPLRLSRTPGGIQGPPPELGADTDDVLRELLALSDDEIADLREDQVVFGPSPSPVARVLEHENRTS